MSNLKGTDFVFTNSDPISDAQTHFEPRSTAGHSSSAKHLHYGRPRPVLLPSRSSKSELSRLVPNEPNIYYSSLLDPEATSIRHLTVRSDEM